MASLTTGDQTAQRVNRAGTPDDPAAAAVPFGAVAGGVCAKEDPRDRGADQVSMLVRDAQALQAAGALDVAEDLWARASALRPDHANLALMLARARLALGRHHAALEVVENVLAREADHPAALDTKGCILRDLGRETEAETCHKAALGQGVQDAGPLNHLGTLALAQGDREQAVDYYTRALEMAPDQPDLHHNLSRAKRYSRRDPHLNQMLQQAAASRNDSPSDASLHFALFNALDQIGEPDAAFAFLESGNALRNAGLGYDVKQEAQQQAFNKRLLSEPVARLTGCDPAPFRVILTVGLPRSGTTLTERILAQAPGVKPCGELSVLPNVLAPLLSERAAANADTLDRAHLVALRERLLSSYAPYAGDAGVIVDKMPLNFRHAGFLCAAMPEARVIDLSRDPMAVAWSIYRHLFAGNGNPFAYSIANICAFMLLHRHIMTFWKAQFGGQIHSLDYAALTEDPETRIRELIDACDLPWSDDCLTPHLGRGAVLTASSAQVRQPIYAGSDNAWQRYASKLGPMRHALMTTGLLAQG